MKIIVSFMLLVLFIGCSGDDNTVNSPAKTVIGTWDLYSSGTKLGQWVFKSDGTVKIGITTWKISDDIMPLISIETNAEKLVKVEIISDDVWVGTFPNEPEDPNTTITFRRVSKS